MVRHHLSTINHDIRTNFVGLNLETASPVASFAFRIGSIIICFTIEAIFHYPTFLGHSEIFMDAIYN